MDIAGAVCAGSQPFRGVYRHPQCPEAGGSASFTQIVRRKPAKGSTGDTGISLPHLSSSRTAVTPRRRIWKDQPRVVGIAALSGSAPTAALPRRTSTVAMVERNAGTWTATAGDTVKGVGDSSRPSSGGRAHFVDTNFSPWARASLPPLLVGKHDSAADSAPRGDGGDPSLPGPSALTGARPPSISSQLALFLQSQKGARKPESSRDATGRPSTLMQKQSNRGARFSARSDVSEDASGPMESLVGTRGAGGVEAVAARLIDASQVRASQTGATVASKSPRGANQRPPTALPTIGAPTGVEDAAGERKAMIAMRVEEIIRKSQLRQQKPLAGLTGDRFSPSLQPAGGLHGTHPHASGRSGPDGTAGLQHHSHHLIVAAVNRASPFVAFDQRMRALRAAGGSLSPPGSRQVDGMPRRRADGMRSAAHGNFDRSDGDANADGTDHDDTSSRSSNTSGTSDNGRSARLSQARGEAFLPSARPSGPTASAPATLAQGSSAKHSAPSAIRNRRHMKELVKISEGKLFEIQHSRVSAATISPVSTPRYRSCSPGFTASATDGESTLEQTTLTAEQELLSDERGGSLSLTNAMRQSGRLSLRSRTLRVESVDASRSGTTYGGTTAGVSPRCPTRASVVVDSGNARLSTSSVIELGRTASMTPGLQDSATFHLTEPPLPSGSAAEAAAGSGRGRGATSRVPSPFEPKQPRRSPAASVVAAYDLEWLKRGGERLLEYRKKSYCAPTYQPNPLAPLPLTARERTLKVSRARWSRHAEAQRDTRKGCSTKNATAGVGVASTRRVGLDVDGGHVERSALSANGGISTSDCSRRSSATASGGEEQKQDGCRTAVPPPPPAKPFASGGDGGGASAPRRSPGKSAQKGRGTTSFETRHPVHYRNKPIKPTTAMVLDDATQHRKQLGDLLRVLRHRDETFLSASDKEMTRVRDAQVEAQHVKKELLLESLKRSQVVLASTTLGTETHGESSTGGNTPRGKFAAPEVILRKVRESARVASLEKDSDDHWAFAQEYADVLEKVVRRDMAAVLLGAPGEHEPPSCSGLPASGAVEGGGVPLAPGGESTCGAGASSPGTDAASPPCGSASVLPGVSTNSTPHKVHVDDSLHPEAEETSEAAAEPAAGEGPLLAAMGSSSAVQSGTTAPFPGGSTDHDGSGSRSTAGPRGSSEQLSRGSLVLSDGMKLLQALLTALAHSRQVTNVKHGKQTLADFLAMIPSHFTTFQIAYDPLVRQFLGYLSPLFGVTSAELTKWIESVSIDESQHSAKDLNGIFRQLNKNIAGLVLPRESRVRLTLHACFNILSSGFVPFMTGGSVGRGTVQQGRAGGSSDTKVGLKRDRARYTLRIRAEEQTFSFNGKVVFSHNEQRSTWHMEGIEPNAAPSSSPTTEDSESGPFVSLRGQRVVVHLYDEASPMVLSILENDRVIGSSEFNVQHYPVGRPCRMSLPVPCEDAPQAEVALTVELLPVAGS